MTNLHHMRPDFPGGDPANGGVADPEVRSYSRRRPSVGHACADQTHFIGGEFGRRVCLSTSKALWVFARPVCIAVRAAVRTSVHAMGRASGCALWMFVETLLVAGR